jgi:protein ImuA
MPLLSLPMNARFAPDAANRNEPSEARAFPERAHQINALKDRIAALERSGASAFRPCGQRLRDRLVRLGLPDLDGHLPGGGLARGGLHELAGAGQDREQAAAAAGFAALWLSRLQEAGPVLWIARAASSAAIDLHAHGLRQLRLDPDRLILVAARKDDEALWAMEEGLKARSLGAVLGEVGKLDLTASRRLQLAAEASGVTAFVLRRWRLMQQAEREAAQPIAALTRWRIAALPGEGETRWKVELARCRGGRPNLWMMETADGSARLHAAPLSGDLAEVLGHGSPAARAALDPTRRDAQRSAAG